MREMALQERVARMETVAPVVFLDSSAHPDRFAQRAVDPARPALMAPAAAAAVLRQA
jgi:hypothetical protein